MVDLSKIIVLIVDDSELSRKSMSAFLEKIGVGKVMAMADGQEAHDFLSEPLNIESYPDIMLVDWQMPQMDGMKLFSLVKSNPLTEKIHFIMVTSNREAEQVSEAVLLGVTDYIVKPFNRDVIEKKIIKVLKRR